MINLSIIIPVYNNDRYLSYCLDSLLLHQNCPKSDYEVIIINDGSTDGSLRIMREYEKKYPNIKVIIQENSGVSVARNNGLAVANGDYVWFVDGDDFVKANCLNRIFDIIKTGIEVYHFNAFRFSDEEFNDNMIFGDYPGTTQPDIWTYIFSRKFVIEHDVQFVAGIHYSETLLFVNDIMLFKPKLQSDNMTIYYYRRSLYSVSVTNKHRKIECYFDFFDYMIERLKGNYYPKENSLDVILSILEMRFLYAMDENTILTEEDIKRGIEQSEFVYSLILSNDNLKSYKSKFDNFKKLSCHIYDDNWSNYLNQWRGKFYRDKKIKNIVKHPRRTLRNMIVGGKM